jgi:protein gp37
MPTKIEWTDESWNPIRAIASKTGRSGWHCVKVSDGCKHCYAETLNQRFGTRLPYDAASKRYVYVDDRVLGQPLRWRKPRRVFVASMTDIFGEWVTDEWIDQMFAIMAVTPQHTYQVLTKRPERMCNYLRRAEGTGRLVDRFGAQQIERVTTWYQQITRWLDEGSGGFFCGRWDQVHDLAGSLASLHPLPNVWIGVTAENQQTADERIPLLLQCPASVRFVSCEPLLGPVNLRRAHYQNGGCEAFVNALTGLESVQSTVIYAGEPVNWVICGGESGPGARPMKLEWARSLRDQCAAADVPFFFKQWGGANKAATGRELDGRTWNEMPEVTR